MIDPSEIQAQRKHALQIFEAAIQDQNPLIFCFLFDQYANTSPPNMVLLNGILDDIRERIRHLKQTQFEMRENFFQQFETLYNVNLTSVLPWKKCESYFSLTCAELMSLSNLESSHETQGACAELNEQLVKAGAIQMQLYDAMAIERHVTDWISAVTLMNLRGEWYFERLENHNDYYH